METEKIINEFEELIRSIPDDHEIFVGYTTNDEDVVKVHCDLPPYWLLKTFEKKRLASAVYDYFIRKNLKRSRFEEKSSSSSTHYSVFVFGLPKKRISQKNSKKGCFGFVLLSILLIFSFIFLLIKL